MTKLIHPMSHIPKASHGWQPQEIKYTFYRDTERRQGRVFSISPFLSWEFNSTQFNLHNKEHNPSLSATQWHFLSRYEFELNNLSLWNEAMEILLQPLLFHYVEGNFQNAASAGMFIVCTCLPATSPLYPSHSDMRCHFLGSQSQMPTV